MGKKLQDGAMSGKRKRDCVAKSGKRSIPKQGSHNGYGGNTVEQSSGSSTLSIPPAPSSDRDSLEMSSTCGEDAADKPGSVEPTLDRTRL